MGYTNKTIDIIEPLLQQFNIKSVCDLGAQNDYSKDYKKPVYISEWYKSKGIEYVSIDLNGENDALTMDLSEPLKLKRQFDMVVDAGTSEHVKGYYQCLLNIHNLTKTNGIIVRENPKTGNWPKHGYNYVDINFYKDLSVLGSAYEILHLEEHPACWNITDGWNIIAVLKKVRKEFVSELPKYYNV